MRGSGILKDEAPGANASICLQGSSFALRSPIKQRGELACGARDGVEGAGGDAVGDEAGHTRLLEQLDDLGGLLGDTLDDGAELPLLVP